MIKRIIPVVLIIAIILSLGVFAFAVEEDTNPDYYIDESGVIHITSDKDTFNIILSDESPAFIVEPGDSSKYSFTVVDDTEYLYTIDMSIEKYVYTNGYDMDTRASWTNPLDNLCKYLVDLIPLITTSNSYIREKIEAPTEEQLNSVCKICTRITLISLNKNNLGKIFYLKSENAYYTVVDNPNYYRNYANANAILSYCNSECNTDYTNAEDAWRNYFFTKCFTLDYSDVIFGENEITWDLSGPNTSNIYLNTTFGWITTLTFTRTLYKFPVTYLFTGDVPEDFTVPIDENTYSATEIPEAVVVGYNDVKTDDYIYSFEGWNAPEFDEVNGWLFTGNWVKTEIVQEPVEEPTPTEEPENLPTLNTEPEQPTPEVVVNNKANTDSHNTSTRQETVNYHIEYIDDSLVPVSSYKMTDTVKTGDNSIIAVYIGIAVLAALVFAFVIILINKKK